MLCYALLCYAICYAMLRYYRPMLYAMLHNTMLYSAIWYALLAIMLCYLLCYMQLQCYAICYNSMLCYIMPLCSTFFFLSVFCCALSLFALTQLPRCSALPCPWGCSEAALFCPGYTALHCYFLLCSVQLQLSCPCKSCLCSVLAILFWLQKLPWLLRQY